MSKINKIITNYPVSLTNDEVENLSLTLSAVRTSGSNNAGKIYYGDGFVNVNNTSNIISLTTEANEKLNQPIPTKVSELTDSASYQTVAGMEDYSTKGYVNDASANALGQAKTWVETQKYLTSIPDSYALKTDIPMAVTQLTDSGNYYQKTETSGISELNAAFESKQDNLTQEQLSAISSVSSIKGTILAGDANIRTTSAEDGNNIKWTIELTAQPVVTDTTLRGYDGIVATKDSTIDSQWNVGIAQAYKEQIEAVSSKLTQADADTLYAPISVANNYVTKSELETTSGELLTTAQYKADSATFLTEHQSLDNYATKEYADNASANALSQAEAWVETQKYLKEIPDTYALKADIPTTVAQLTDSGNYYQKTETSGKTEIANALTTKVDKPSQTGKLVYDGDSNAWVTLPEGTATVVQGQGSVTSNYDSSNSTYTVSLLASAENALNKVDDKIDTTAVEQTYQTISDMSNYLTTSDASTAYQPIGNYATTSAISDMATQTWVGQQGFYTKASGDNDYAPKTITAAVNTLTDASAGWNEVTAKLDAIVASTTYQTKEDMNGYLTKSEASTTYQPTGNYLISDDITGKLDKSVYSNASGNWENAYNTVSQYSAAGTWLTAHQSLTDYYTKSETSGANELAAEFTKYITSGNITAQDTDYVMTTTGWKVLTLPGGGMTQVIHDTTLTGQGSDDSKLGVAWPALSGNTIASALSADSATVATNLGTSSFADITSAINAKADATAISDMLTKTDAAQTYQTITGMSNYLTTSDASTTYQPKGNYATTSDITDMATQTWVGQQGFIKKDANDLTYYYKKTETSGANELATEFTKYVSTGDILTAANDTLTGIKIGSTSYKVPTTDLSNYYTKSETSATGELNAEFAKKLDSTIASSTYQTIIGMSAYLTTAAASQTYLDKITYASDSATFVTSATVTSNDGKYVLTKTGWQLVTIPTKVADLTDSANYVVTGDILTGTGNTLTGIKIGNTDYKIPDDYAKPSGNYQNLSAGSATSAYSAYSANHATAADIATSAYINANTTSAMSAIVDELHGKLDSTAISDMLTKTEAAQTYQPKGTYATETYTNEASANALSEAKTWVEGQDFLKNTDLTGYAMKTYVDTASAAALSQSKSWVEQQNFVTSAGLVDNTRYEMTNTGWTSAIKIQVDSEVPTANDGILHIILESQ